ncbi:MAG: hypothetical protein LBK28_07985, partial [Propionibacteriaceae bacterium]|nr:hypothetical protein [Propionibacteriaceae bacterium]
MSTDDSRLIFVCNFKRMRKILIIWYGLGTLICLIGVISVFALYTWTDIPLENYAILQGTLFIFGTIIWLIPLIWALKFPDARLEEMFAVGALPFLPFRQQHFRVNSAGIRYYGTKVF